MNHYRKPINKVVDGVKLKMRISALTLKISENNDKIDDLLKVDKNFNSKISSNINELNNIKNDISSNFKKIENIENDISAQIKSKIFDERYTVKNKSFNDKDFYLLFKTKILHNFTNKRILEINSKFNYNNLNSKISHEYKFYNQKGISFYKITFDLDNDIIKENFVNNCQNTDRLSIQLLLINKEKYNADLYNYNYIDIIYNDNINASLINTNENAISSNLEKIDINKNAISSNLGKIGTNENAISSNLGKIETNENSISSNLGKINNISKNISINISNDIFYNEDTQINFSNDLPFFEKEYNISFKKNDFLELYFKILLNYVNINYKNYVKSIHKISNGKIVLYERIIGHINYTSFNNYLTIDENFFIILMKILKILLFL